MIVTRMRRGVRLHLTDPEFEAIKVAVLLGLRNLETDEIDGLRRTVRAVFKEDRWRIDPLAIDEDRRPEKPVLAAEAVEKEQRGYWAAHDARTVYGVGTSPRAAERHARKRTGLQFAPRDITPIARSLYRKIKRDGWDESKGFVVKRGMLRESGTS